MEKTIIITGAGGGGTNNLVHSIKKSKYPVRIVGTNMDKYALAKSPVKTNYLVPPSWEPAYIEALNDIIAKENIDLIVPNSDREVRAVSENREKLECKTFLPSKEAIKLCQDKWSLHRFLEWQKLDTAKTVQIKTISDVRKKWLLLKAIVPDADKFWVRIRDESGSMASLPVVNVFQAEAWIWYWSDMREISPDRFLISEYLSGRDYAFQSLWKDGEPVIAKTCERLRYVFAKQMPSGTSSTPAVGKLVYNDEVVETCVKAVKLIDPEAQGNYCIDLKEDAEGIPHITEINIGRFFMITNIFNLTGRYNMAELYLRLAFDEEVQVPEDLRFTDYPTDIYLIRELDTLPTIVAERDL